MFVGALCLVGRVPGQKVWERVSEVSWGHCPGELLQEFLLIHSKICASVFSFCSYCHVSLHLAKIGGALPGAVDVPLDVQKGQPGLLRSLWGPFAVGQVCLHSPGARTAAPRYVTVRNRRILTAPSGLDVSVGGSRCRHFS